MRTRGDIDQKYLSELYYQYMNAEEDFVKDLFFATETRLGRVYVQEPILTDYAPVLEIARQTKELIDGYYCQREQLVREMKQLGVTTNHLAVIFKQQYGVPPIQYLNLLRAEQAKNMLAETDMSIIDIAGDIGFNSLPAFYSFFKRQTGTTPKKYRARAIGGGK